MLLTRIRELIGQFPRYGYRMITRMLCREGWSVNFKRVYRIWKQESFRVPRKKTKKRRLGSTEGGISRRVQEFLERIDVGTSFIQPGSPWENGYVESFHSRFQDERLSCEEFTTLHEAQEIIGPWRSTYNHRRPYSSLSGLTPAEFAASCSASTPVAALTALKRNNERDLLNQNLSS